MATRGIANIRLFAMLPRKRCGVVGVPVLQDNSHDMPAHRFIFVGDCNAGKDRIALDSLGLYVLLADGVDNPTAGLLRCRR